MRSLLVFEHRWLSGVGGICWDSLGCISEFSKLLGLRIQSLLDLTYANKLRYLGPVLRVST